MVPKIMTHFCDAEEAMKLKHIYLYLVLFHSAHKMQLQRQEME
jgi:hypothetical protein